METADPVPAAPHMTGRFRIPHWGWGALAAVILLIVALGLRFGIPAHRQYRAIREVEASGGFVWTQKTRPEWLRERVRDEWMRVNEEVLGVRFSGPEVTDSSLKPLYQLTSVSKLELDHTSITDAGLEHLDCLTRLTHLWLNDTEMGDSVLETVGRLTNLESLHLDRTLVTDAGLKHLKGLTKLRGLTLANTAISDFGLEFLGDLANLEVSVR